MATTEESDETLIGRYARDDAAAFDQLYRRHELRVWRYFERNVCSQATSDELLQEIWFTLARNIASLESTTRFRTRLFTLAHDRMADSLRTRAAQANPATTAGRPAAAHDPANALTQAIGQLPGDQRHAYLLQAEGDLSVGDIAVITDSTIDTTQSRLRSAKLKLRELLNENVSEAPSSEDQVNEVDQLYRRLSAQDPGRPGEWVRRKVQAYSAQQAAERAVRASTKAKEGSGSVAPPPTVVTPIPTAEKQTAGKRWLLPVIFGAAAVAALVGFLVVPPLMSPRDTSLAEPPPAVASQPETASAQVAQEPTPPSSESASSAPPSQSSEPTRPTSPAPASVTTSNAPPPNTAAPVTPRSSAPPAPAAASRSAGTSRADSMLKARVARQSAADLESARISRAPAAATVQPTRSAPPAESAPAPQSAPTPTPDMQVASAPTPPLAIPTVSPPAPAPTPAPTPAAAIPTPPDGLWRAAESGDLNGLQTALANNVDVNARDANGRTALLLAIQHNHGAIVRALLAHGANPNTPDSHGTTPLMQARIIANWGVFAALQRSGAH